MHETDQLARAIEAAGRIALFTGAGISTESGIPDFRSPGGIWTRKTSILFKDFMDSEAARQDAWRRRFEGDAAMRAARPNRGHRAVEALIRRGRAQAVVTQNIDGLHQQSGLDPEQVVELHGNTTYATCLECDTRHEIDEMRAVFEQSGNAPRCRRCRGLVKTATISFGQPMPEAAMRRARAEAQAADLFIVLGSSLVVYPAAGLPVLAVQNGAKLAIINREPTPMDEIADILVRRPIGEAFGDAVGIN
jgi:NAD-dependent deacetylase